MAVDLVCPCEEVSSGSSYATILGLPLTDLNLKTDAQFSFLKKFKYVWSNLNI